MAAHKKIRCINNHDPNNWRPSKTKTLKGTIVESRYCLLCHKVHGRKHYMEEKRLLVIGQIMKRIEHEIDSWTITTKIEGTQKLELTEEEIFHMRNIFAQMLRRRITNVRKENRENTSS